MNPDSPKTPREKLEARVTALLLGELSGNEAAAMRDLIAHDPEFAALHERLKQAISLVRDAAAPQTETTSAPAEPLQLSEERRKKLLAQFLIPPLKERDLRPRRKFRMTLIELLVVVALVGILAAMLMPTLSSFKSREHAFVATTTSDVEARNAADLAAERLPADRMEQTVSAAGPGSNNVHSLNVVGYVNVAAKNVQPAQTPLAATSGSAGSGEQSAFRNYLDQAQRRLTENQTLKRGDDVSITQNRLQVSGQVAPPDSSPGFSTVTSPSAAPRAQIVLPSPAPDDSTWGSRTRGSGIVEQARKGSANTSSSFIGDPEWLGVLQKPEAPHSENNAFVSRYASVATPSASERAGEFRYSLGLQPERYDPAGSPVATLKSGAGQNQSQVRAYDDFNSLTYTPRPPVVLPTTGLSAGEQPAGGTPPRVTDSTLVNKDNSYAGATFGGTAVGGGGGGARYFIAPGNSGQEGKANDAQPLVSENIELQYASPANVASAVQQLRADSRSEVVPQSSGKGITLLGPREDIATAEELARKLDTPTKQVLIESKVTELSKDDNQALGFDWYLGNKLTKGTREIAGQSGTTPSPAGQPAPTTTPPAITTLSDGAVDVNGDKATVLGDLPAAGKFFRSKSSPSETKSRGFSLLGPADTGGLRYGFSTNAVASVGDEVRGKTGAGTLTVSGANRFSGGTVVNNGSLALDMSRTESQKNTSLNLNYADVSRVPEGARIAPEGGVYSLNVVGYTVLPTAPSPSTAGAVQEAVRRQPSSIVLPAQEETSEALKDRSVRDDALSVAPSKPADVSALGGVETTTTTGRRNVRARVLRVTEKQGIGAAPGLVQDGKLLLEAGKLDDAEGKLRDAIKADPKNHAAEYYLALAQEQRSAKRGLGRDSKERLVEVEQADELLRPGMVDFPAIDVNQALKIYAELSGKTVLRPTNLPEVQISLKTHDPMTKKEAIRSLDQMLATNGISIIEVGDKFIKAVPVAQAGVSGSPATGGALPASSGEPAEKARSYQEAKLRLEELQRFRQTLDVKKVSEKADVGLAKTMPAEVDKADPKSARSKTLWQRLTGEVESTARIRFDRDVADISGLAVRSGDSAYDPYFVQSEFEILSSEAVLGKVVEKLKLDEAWAKKENSGHKLQKTQAAALLRKRLDVKLAKNTNVLEITVKGDEPKEAADIANAIIEAYRDAHTEIRSRVGSIEAFELEKKVRDAKKEVERLQQELEVEPDVVAPRRSLTNAPIPQPEIQTSENNFSTFSLNVSDVSFKLAAASLEKGQMPEPASVRSEEFINAFDYRDPEPAAGAQIAFAWERARYPFAHNRDLLRFSLKTAAAGRQAGRPLNIVLLLDNSGSMERADRVSIIREALRVLAGQLQPQDKLSVITFARTARLVADGISGDKAGEVAEAVSGLTPQGGTNLEDAMNLAYQAAARHYLANGINRVVLLTDGAANLGDVEPDSLKQKVEAQRKQGIALDCFGIGWEGFNDDLLEVLSRNGDGRYGFINSPEEAATDFVGQLAGALHVAASDVKVQVEFNPKRTTAYRQIGYAKHQLTKEQFRDNTVDAAEIAAQEAGNALYTVEVNPAGEGPLCTVRVRYKVPGTTDYREQSWDVPYTGNALSLEQSSPAMRLAASASAFSEWLVASPFAGEVTPDRALGVLSGVPKVFGADSRPKKLEWMIRQAKSIEGK